MSQTRRLAAILAADVVGYSRLIGADEAGTLQAFKTIKAELFDPTIAAHSGRLVKTTGDGFLVEFSSVVDALRCAVEAQASMIQRNAEISSDRRIEFRIGILCHEHGRSKRPCATVREMKEGPSRSAIRC